MNNYLKITVVSFFAWLSCLFLVSFLEAAPNAPTNFQAVNFGGPIRLSWTASTGGLVPVTYTIYRVESDSTTIPTDPPTSPYGGYAQTVVFSLTSTNYIDTATVDGTTYYYFVTGNDTTGESSPASNIQSATSDYPDADFGYFLNLTATEYTIDYETTTVVNPSTGTIITYTITNTDQFGNRWVAAKINYDIIDNYTDSSIFKETQEISGGTSGISTGQIAWDGSWFNTTQWTKHNGTYTVKVWATDFAGTDHPESTLTITVHVVHVNDIVLGFTDYGTETVAHAGPYKISYQLTQPAFTTIRIYNVNGTLDTGDDTLVKTIINQTPRDWEYLTRDVRCMDFWDLKDDNGTKVPHAKYRFQIDAYQDHATNGRDSSASRGWEFAYDFRIVDVSATGINPDESLAKIKYTLTDTAQVKIIITKSNTTFSLGADGEPVPDPTANLVKTFTFYRNAGNQEETWDGLDENGNTLDNGIYKFVISAKDVDGNHAIDASDNDYMIVGEITIEKTASQVATDSTAPTVVSTNPANGVIISTAFSLVSAVLQDETGGSGVSLSSSTITLSDPAGNPVTGAQSNNGTDTITLTFSTQTATGTYTIRVTPKDKAGNTAAQSTYTFIFDPTVDTIPPNVVSTTPANGATITVPFTEVVVTLQDNSGGSGVDLEGTTVTLADPNWDTVQGTQKNNDLDSVKLSFSTQQSIKGVYTIRVTPKDKAGNTGTMYTATFTLSTDTIPPNVVSTTPANNSSFSVSFTEVSAKLQDNTGGSGVDFDSSTITLSDPNGSIVPAGQTNDGVDTIKLAFAAQTLNGTYTVIVTPRDKAGNTGSQVTIAFTLNTEENFKDSVYVYPNPAKNRKATFAYMLSASATVVIEVYTIMGEKIWSKTVYDNTAGTKLVTWNCANDDGETVADELYLYKITAEYSNGNTKTAMKKLLVVK